MNHIVKREKKATNSVEKNKRLNFNEKIVQKR